jgi:hypothetical protein
MHNNNNNLKSCVNDFIDQLNSIENEYSKNEKYFVTGSFFSKLFQIGIIGFGLNTYCRINHHNDKNNRKTLIDTTDALAVGSTLLDIGLGYLKNNLDEKCHDNIRDYYSIYSVNLSKLADKDAIHDSTLAYNQFLRRKIESNTFILPDFLKYLEQCISNLTKRLFNKSFSFKEIINFFDSNNKIPTLITFSQSALCAYQNLPSAAQFKLVIIFTFFVVCFHVVHFYKIYTSQCDLKQNIHKFKESIKSYAN